MGSWQVTGSSSSNILRSKYETNRYIGGHGSQYNDSFHIYSLKCLNCLGRILATCPWYLFSIIFCPKISNPNIFKVINGKKKPPQSDGPNAHPFLRNHIHGSATFLLFVLRSCNSPFSVSFMPL